MVVLTRTWRLTLSVAFLLMVAYLLMTGGTRQSTAIASPRMPPLTAAAQLDPLRQAQAPKAAFVMLLSSAVLEDVLITIRSVEDRFNRHHHYDWVFLNTTEITQEFRDQIRVFATGTVSFALIPSEHWTVSPHMDRDQFEAAVGKHEGRAGITKDAAFYYQNRFKAGFLAKQKVLDPYAYIWLIDPGVIIHCDVQQDPFEEFRAKDLSYGFAFFHTGAKVLSQSLWAFTRMFVTDRGEFLHKDNLLVLVSEDEGFLYNTCQYRTSIEISALSFWRSEAYQAYFKYLDNQKLGFFDLDNQWFSELVKAIATSLFLPRSGIKFLDNIGVEASPMINCPRDSKVRKAHNCQCNLAGDFTWLVFSCVPSYYRLHGLMKPPEWG